MSGMVALLLLFIVAMIAAGWAATIAFITIAVLMGY
jgi:hypothetical protein